MKYLLIALVLLAIGLAAWMVVSDSMLPDCVQGQTKDCVSGA